MVIGFDDKQQALVVDDEGQMMWVPLDGLRLDWRYDWRTGTWIDVGPYEDAEDTDGDEETADDRGAEVSGDVPDTDGTDGSGEVSGEEPDDQAAGGVDAREEGGTD
jgi:hypothetical protein